MAEADVEQFLWELEQALSHLPGDRRRELVRQADKRLHEVAARIAAHEGATDLTWYHYVQATAEVGPPEALAADLTGEPLPDKARDHRRLWAVVGALGLVVLGVLAYALVTHGTLEQVGQWSGTEEGTTDQRALAFNVSEEAESVFLSVTVTPSTGQSAARVTILDGQANLVHEQHVTVQNHMELTRYLQGEPGTWRVLIDFQNYTGAWRVDARQELP